MSLIPRPITTPRGMAPIVMNQRGFTLLEILVAIVVLSIGLLGLAGLQAVSLNNNQVAYYRSIASQQAYDMADRLRANQGTPTTVGVRAGHYDNLPTTPAPAGSMARTDWTQWLANTAAMLPNGTGTVSCVSGCVLPPIVATSNRIFDITVSWTEKTQAGTPTQSFVTRVTP